MLRRLETLFAVALYYSGVVKLALWWTQRSGPRLVILCYHYASGGYLWQHLRYLSPRYRILPLEDALEELHKPDKGENQRKDHRTLLALTFDDGYHDNYTYGFALARKLQIPITLFLVPGYVNSERRFWWQEPDALVQHTRLKEVTVEGSTYHLSNLDERNQLVQAIDAGLRYATSVAEREEFLARVRRVLGDPLSEYPEEKALLPLTWTEVHEMEESKWVSFGAHTLHHPILAYLANPDEVQNEVSESRAVLERHLGHLVHTFAYPVGKREHIGEHGLSAVRAAKYGWALTTIHGVNTPQTDPLLLHRIVVDVDHHWWLVAAKASGAWDFFTSWCRMPITFMIKKFHHH